MTRTNRMTAPPAPSAAPDAPAHVGEGLRGRVHATGVRPPGVRPPEYGAPAYGLRRRGQQPARR